MVENTKALARRENTGVALSQVNASAIKQLAEYQQKNYNILTPIAMTEYPEGSRLSVRAEKVELADTYNVNGKQALKGNTIDRLATCAGITWTRVKRIDDRKHPHYCEYEVWCRIVDIDGTVRDGFGTRSIDLREDAGGGIRGADLEDIICDAKEKNRSPEKEIRMARKFIVSLCESKAKNRAMRHHINIKGAYTKEELSKPFVVVKILPDYGNVENKRMLSAQLMGATAALYGHTQAGADVVEDAEYDEPEAQPEPGQVPEQDQNSEPDQAPEPAADGKERVIDAWKQFKKGGGTPQAWRALVLKATGKDAEADFTEDEVFDIMNAVFEADGGAQ